MEVNGISLHVEDSGSGPAVLLLHGWPDSTYPWRHQVPYLLSHGFRVIAFDLRGFGGSDKPQEVSAFALLPADTATEVALRDLAAESAPA